MIVKKIAGKVYGAKLTKDEEKAMDIEILKEIKNLNEKNMVEIDALVLWILYESFGFRKTRLRRFFEMFIEGMKDLNERYEMEKSDLPWICTKKLLDHGIDIQKWDEEVKED